MQKTTYVLGIHRGHNSTVALLRNGKVVYCASEERFIREKNTEKFPFKAIEYILQTENITTDDIDLLVYCNNFPHPYVETKMGEEYTLSSRTIQTSATIINKISLTFPVINRLAYSIYFSIFAKYLAKKFRSQISKFITSKYNIDKNKIVFVDHHTCHAYAAYYGFAYDDLKNKNTLILTADGEGDGKCATVNLVDQGVWKPLSVTPAGKSLAEFYAAITVYMGMKKNEHEYKVMGLAPYTSQYILNQTYPLFKPLFWIEDDLTFGSKYGSGMLIYVFDKILKRKRFDSIAGAAQKYLEDVLKEWVIKCTHTTNVRDIVVSGGIFMNVKVNKVLADLPEVKSFYACPSSSDESIPIGAVYYGYKMLCGDNNYNPKPIENLYLGIEYSNDYINKMLEVKGIYKKYSVVYLNDIENKIAELLTANNIVARFAGRMEFGARALGNRSILANPANLKSIRIINEMIKNRDFWMPFACSILAERANDYLINPKNIKSYYMIDAFDTTSLAKEQLVAGIHPYDFTCRPQIVTEEMNPKYYKLIKQFENSTGIGGILNTSFNIHGEPIVCSPEDAIYTFENSGLKYLALENYLISKNDGTLEKLFKN